MNRDLLDKFSAVCRDIEAARGPFAMFGLFLRDDNPDAWDVIVAATWMDGSRLKAMTFLADRIARELAPMEMLNLSRIVPMRTDDPWVVRLAAEFAGQTFPAERTSFEFAGAWIDMAFILSARPQSDHAAAGA